MDKVINITNLRKELYKMAETVIKEGSVINVSTKDGSFVMMSKADYDALMETLYLSNNPGYHKTLLEGKDAPQSDFIDEKDVKW